ncbi:hypothetical protein ABS735_14850 [Streptomyces sp. MMCC 100]|uniref:hypothetical protein n=1 Tax=Streptomyces sp. MMCC 100 TaxID=3163555 RepID=UPI0035954591
MTTDGNHESSEPEFNETLTEFMDRRQFEVLKRGEGLIQFRRGQQARYLTLPERDIPVLVEQISGHPEPHPEFQGVVSTKGRYVEVAVRPGLPRPISVLLRPLVQQHFDCEEHTRDPFPRTSPAEDRHGSREGTAVSWHMRDASSGCCLELSTISPCATLFGNGRFSPLLRWNMVAMSVKIAFGEELDKKTLLSRSRGILDSFLFELDVRNGIPMVPVRMEKRRSFAADSSAKRSLELRFPRTSVRPEVSELFSFAASAASNPPLSFLSYYQVLEYFFPTVAHRNTIRKVRRELSDPLFDSAEDFSIARIVSSVERAAISSEESQLKVLVNDCVRTDRLQAFFCLDEWENHFSKSGPISGIEYINVKNPQKSLANQVAERIYGLRNRIVHAKDDPKYAQARVLLPQSEEAFSLGPDIALIRLLAVEAVIDAQTTT